MHIELEIERLVMRGIPVRDRGRLQSAIEAELARLLAEGGLPPALSQGGYMPQLNGSAIRVEPGAPVEALGVQIARAAYQGLQR